MTTLIAGLPFAPEGRSAMAAVIDSAAASLSLATAMVRVTALRAAASASAPSRTRWGVNAARTPSFFDAGSPSIMLMTRAIRRRRVPDVAAASFLEVGKPPPPRPVRPAASSSDTRRAAKAPDCLASGRAGCGPWVVRCSDRLSRRPPSVPARSPKEIPALLMVAAVACSTKPAGWRSRFHQLGSRWPWSV